MNTISVNVPGNAYNAIVDADALTSESTVAPLAAIIAGRRCVVISDDNVEALYADRVRTLAEAAGAADCAAAVFPAGEPHKTLETVRRLYSDCIKAGLNRKSVVLALGGGVPGDIAGFVAATYMRGIDFVQLPTTLLAMVDSSVGGKVGVDLPEGKNLVGAFHQPRLVIADVKTLDTLPQRELRCGLAEVVKYGMIMDQAFFAKLEADSQALVRRDPARMTDVVCHCCRLKADVVRRDEREDGCRAILNYGHTFGHALETLTGYERLNHGEAVAIGMAMAMDLAIATGRIPKGAGQRQDALLAALHLPTRLTGSGLAPRQVLQAMRHDKKALNGKLRLVLPQAIGQVEVIDSIEERMIQDAIGGRCD